MKSSKLKLSATFKGYLSLGRAGVEAYLVILRGSILSYSHVLRSLCPEGYTKMEKTDLMLFFVVVVVSKRLDYVNHARRLAEDDWTGMDSEEEDKKDDEEMDIDVGKKLPKRYANQVSLAGKIGEFLLNSLAIQIRVKSPFLGPER